jgi:two-component system chemotaxis response regulator CheB
MTIAQDKGSCLMFGMPQQAISINAARRIIPLQQIASTFKHLIKNK